MINVVFGTNEKLYQRGEYKNDTGFDSKGKSKQKQQSKLYTRGETRKTK